MFKIAALRPLIAASLAVAALSPVAAAAHDRDRDAYREQDSITDMSRRLNDPMNQAKVAATLSALSGMLLSVDVSPLARAMDSVDGGHRADDRPDATLGDFAGDDARDLPYDIARRTPQAMGRMAGMLGALDAMRPQIKDLGHSLQRALREQGLSGH